MEAYIGIGTWPEGWVMTKKLIINNEILCLHDYGNPNNIKNVYRDIMSIITAHRHGTSFIKHVRAGNRNLFRMSVGCLVNETSKQMSYHKSEFEQFVFSVGALVGGIPILIPLKTNSKGRWVGHL